MIEAAIFDMDGLLVDSEPLWKEAEQIAFRRIGIDLSEEECAETTGYNTWDVVQHWYKFKPWDKSDVPFNTLKHDIEIEYLNLLEAEGKPKPGVSYILNFFKSKNLPMALASSSTMKIINTTVEKLNIGHFFSYVMSSESVGHGKPHPAVYIETIDQLKVNPLNILAFEDSFFGLIAAKAARLNIIGVLEPSDYEESRFDFSDLKLKSLNEFGEDQFNAFNQITNN